jgi:hypothetical protein
VVNNYLHILELRLEHEPQVVEQLRLIGAELNRVREHHRPGARTAAGRPEEPGAEPGTLDDVDLNELWCTWSSCCTGPTLRISGWLCRDRVAAYVVLRSDEHRLAQV